MGVVFIASLKKVQEVRNALKVYEEIQYWKPTYRPYRRITF